LQFEDFSEKLAGLPSAEVRFRLQLMAEHKAFVAKARSADPVYQGVMSSPWQR
jgi:hypothetical protein